jgi:hypothetical protein
LTDRPGLWHVPILAGLFVGLALGLIYTWLIEPVQYYDTPPDRLRADLTEEYILLICEAYAADEDWTATQKRLATLDDPDIAATILDLTERAIEQGKPVSTIRHLASVAAGLGVSNPSLAFFLPTRPASPSPTAPRAMATFTPTPPALPTVTATPLPTSPPTFTPQPSPTPSLRYRLLAQQQICDHTRPDPLLQIIIRDAEGNGISGEQVTVSWDGQETTLFSGFKPELGSGYSDLVIQPDISYAVSLASGSESVSGIQTSPCTSSEGPRLLSIRLIFEEITPSS